MFPKPALDVNSQVPLYRQLESYIRELITSRRLEKGERLPATRELAGLLGLNRTTVSAAYELLEEGGFIRGHVGRGSFVAAGPPGSAEPDWQRLMRQGDASPPVVEARISFSTSRPSGGLFPLPEFRAACREVFEGDELPTILQLGSPKGYGPLRRYLLEAARQEGAAGPGDDLMVTSGCQQALDLLQRIFLEPGEAVAIEDPVYPGLRALFSEAGARIVGVPVGPAGVEADRLEAILVRERPKLLVVTPSFQNPTGATLPREERRAVLRAARSVGAVLVENDIYGELRYHGEPLPTLRHIDGHGSTILVRSFSKVSFPGVRVGWVIAPEAVVARLSAAKQYSDLHSDQLSQAVMLRFAESGRLAAHRRKVVAAGSERLAVLLDACARCLPAGARFHRPEGGMNLWVQLPEPLDAGELLARALREEVSYLPGRYFAVSRHEPGNLRLSFAGLSPAEISEGVRVLGRLFSSELERARAAVSRERAPAV